MTSAPTILHVVEAFGGGVQSSLTHFIQSAPFARHVVLGRARSGESTETPEADVLLYEGGSVGFAREMRALTRRIRPDVVHLHSSKAGLLRPIVPRGSRRAYSPHCYAFERRDVSRVARLSFRVAERVLAHVTDVVIAVSPHEARLASSLRASAEVVAVSNLAPIDSFVLRGERSKRVVTVGRIAPQKAPHRYAQVAMSAPDDIEFVWIGDGPRHLREQLVDAGVRVTGWLSPDGVRDELASASLYLHTAAWEASPMSLAQALAAGVPVMCAWLETLESLGYFCVGSDPVSLVQGVRDFFTEPEYAAEVRLGAEDAVEVLLRNDTGQGLKKAYFGCLEGIRRREG